MAGAITVEQVRGFVAEQTLGVVATLRPGGRPHATLVAIAVTDRFELVFDCLGGSTKAANVRRDPRVAVAIGGTVADERTVQCEGLADIPEGAEHERVRDVYLTRFPDARERLEWDGITHVRITPQWLKWWDFTVTPPVIVEWTRDDDGELREG
ncbi:MAG TPA: pyridoxamine 5'-phosphate oxidase family protein [Candidatus Dormibacteraeota bacterium]